ncbi:MAG: endonuclease/exonuclease/phosphatase family protein [Opitutaceae bacterium]|nr:endonuclease/exonuclease/phosphatase family protein [Opitutaceae bacterium]
MTCRLPLLLFLCVTAASAAAPVTLRVMSYNIHHAEGLDGKLDLERIAQVITDAKADLVGLQEVDRGVARTQQRDLPAELARLTGLTVQFDKNIAHQGGDYGNAVLTRFPIKRASNTHLKSFANGEQRGVQQVVLDVHGREVLFLNTHLDARRDPAEREHSATELRAIVQAAGAMPVILVGDFNAAPDAKAIATVREFLTDAWTVVSKEPGFTIPVKKPNKRIDFIWITPASITPVQMNVPYSEASDHLPIVAELRLK